MNDKIAGILLVAMPFVFFIIWIYSSGKAKKKDELRQQQAIKDRNDRFERERQEQKRQEEERELVRKQEFEARYKEREGKKAAKATVFETLLRDIPRIDVTFTEALAVPLPVLRKDEIQTTNITIKSNKDKLGKFIVFDVETTGLSPGKDEIIELAAIKFDDFVPVSMFETFVKPRGNISVAASMVNGITEDMVCDAPRIENVIPAFRDFAYGYNLVAHNMPFDARFIYASGLDFFEWKPKLYDTLKMARAKDKQALSFKLDDLCSWNDIYRASSHRSGSDCLATALIYKVLVDLSMGHLNPQVRIEHMAEMRKLRYGSSSPQP